MEGCSGVKRMRGIRGIMWRDKANTSVSESLKRISASNLMFYFIEVKGISKILMKKSDHAPVLFGLQFQI